MSRILSAIEILPKTLPGSDLLVGRVWSNDQNGPCTVLVNGDVLHDINSASPTISGLLELSDLPQRLRRRSNFPVLGKLDEFLCNGTSSVSAGHLLAPCDLQPIKAAGVTFVDSLLERIIEEQTEGDPHRAEEIRTRLTPIVGDSLTGVKPASEEAKTVTKILRDAGVWSQYLEVGIGPYAEIFSKVPPMSAIGAGHELGIRSDSDWNNPEPEIVLAISSGGTIVGATLGNDVNLRDFEGRSALLLNNAKDNNGSCAIGPFIRLFDKDFSLDHVLKIDVSLTVTGKDGYVVSGVNHTKQISRHPIQLVQQLLNSNHQYPDGVMLFLGTMFVPTQDRDGPQTGFTHKVGDKVEISAPELGCLTNWMNHCDKIPPWTFGCLALFQNLTTRKLI